MPHAGGVTSPTRSGAIWTAQRAYHDSLVAPLIAHAIWTPTVIVLLPVI